MAGSRSCPRPEACDSLNGDACAIIAFRALPVTRQMGVGWRRFPAHCRAGGASRPGGLCPARAAPARR